MRKIHYKIHRKVRKGKRVKLVLKVFKGLKVIKVKLVRKVFKALRETKGILAHKDLKVSVAYKVNKDLKVKRVSRVTVEMRNLLMEFQSWC